MKKITKIVLDLAEVFEGLSQSDTFKLCSEIRQSQNELIALKRRTFDVISMNSQLCVSNDEQIGTLLMINEQLHYVNENLIVLENALLCHESKIFEKRTFIGMKFNVGLN
jgi:hypothetical protein